MRGIDTYRSHGKEGFTLIELIVVLILISLLAAIAVPSYLGYVDSNRTKECAKNREMLAAYLDEMQVTSSDVSMQKVIDAHPEIECPAGGSYQEAGSKNTVQCSLPEHEGVTTVIMKTGGVVTARTDKQPETEPKPTASPAPSGGGSGGETEAPTPTPAPIKLSVTLAPCKVDAENTYKMEPEVTPSDVRCTYSWSIDSPSVASIDANGIVTGKEAGIAIVTCTATPVDSTIDPATVSAQVEVFGTVNAAIDPGAMTLTRGEAESGTLTANVEMSGYTSAECSWKISDGRDASVASVTKIGDRGASVTIGSKEGAVNSTQVTCIVTAKTSLGVTATATATAEVVVEGKAETSSRDVMISKSYVYSDTFVMWLGSEPDIAKLSLPEGGTWSSEDPSVTVSKYGEATVQDNLSSGIHQLTYTLPGGEVYNINAKIVYPINSLEFPHTGDWPDDWEKYEKERDISQLVTEEEMQIWLAYQPPHSADRKTITWSSSDPNVAVVERVRETSLNEYGIYKGFSIATVRGVHPGKATIKMTVYNEYEGCSYEKEKEIQVTEPDQLTGININSVSMDVGQTQTLQITPTPWNASLQKVTFRYTFEGDCIEIDQEAGTVTALKYGSTRVHAEAVKNETVLAECWFDVNVAKLDNLWVTPGNIALTPGETTPVQIGYSPGNADIGDVAFEFDGYDPNVCEVTGDPNNKTTINVKGIAQGQPQTVTVRAIMDGQLLRTAQFTVNVSRIKSMEITPNPVTIPANGTQTATLRIEPANADLQRIVFEMDGWVSYALKIDSIDLQKGEITFRSLESTGGDFWTNIYAKENGVTLKSCQIHINVQ